MRFLLSMHDSQQQIWLTEKFSPLPRKPLDGFVSDEHRISSWSYPSILVSVGEGVRHDILPQNWDDKKIRTRN